MPQDLMKSTTEEQTEAQRAVESRRKQIETFFARATHNMLQVSTQSLSVFPRESDRVAGQSDDVDALIRNAIIAIENQEFEKAAAYLGPSIYALRQKFNRQAVIQREKFLKAQITSGLYLKAAQSLIQKELAEPTQRVNDVVYKTAEDGKTILRTMTETDVLAFIKPVLTDYEQFVKDYNADKKKFTKPSITDFFSEFVDKAFDELLNLFQRAVNDDAKYQKLIKDYNAYKKECAKTSIAGYLSDLIENKRPIFLNAETRDRIRENLPTLINKEQQFRRMRLAFNLVVKNRNEQLLQTLNSSASQKSEAPQNSSANLATLTFREVADILRDHQYDIENLSLPNTTADEKNTLLYFFNRVTAVCNDKNDDDKFSVFIDGLNEVDRYAFPLFQRFIQEKLPAYLQLRQHKNQLLEKELPKLSNEDINLILNKYTEQMEALKRSPKRESAQNKKILRHYDNLIRLWQAKPSHESFATFIANPANQKFKQWVMDLIANNWIDTRALAVKSKKEMLKADCTQSIRQALATEQTSMLAVIRQQLTDTLTQEAHSEDAAVLQAVQDNVDAVMDNLATFATETANTAIADMCSIIGDDLADMAFDFHRRAVEKKDACERDGAALASLRSKYLQEVADEKVAFVARVATLRLDRDPQQIVGSLIGVDSLAKKAILINAAKETLAKSSTTAAQKEFLINTLVQHGVNLDATLLNNCDSWKLRENALALVVLPTAAANLSIERKQGECRVQAPSLKYLEVADQANAFIDYQVGRFAKFFGFDFQTQQVTVAQKKRQIDNAIAIIQQARTTGDLTPLAQLDQKVSTTYQAAASVGDGEQGTSVEMVHVNERQRLVTNSRRSYGGIN